MSKRAIMESTKFCVSLSLNVIAADDDTGGIRLATYPILYLTGLIMALWGFGNLVSRIGYNLAGLYLDCQQLAYRLTEAIFSFWLSPLVFGAG